MTTNNNEIKVLGKYRLDEIWVTKPVGSEKEGFFVEETDEQVFPTLWDEAYEFCSDGYAAVKKDERWGFINVMGELVVPYRWKDFRYDQFCFPEGLCAVQDDQDLWGFINAKGEVILPCQWKNCRDFRNGECAVKDAKDLWVYVDKTGNFIRASKWKEIGEWDEENGLLSVQDESGLWGFADKNDCLQILCKWKETNLFEKIEESALTRYLCWVMNQEGLWGCIDKRGRVVIACSWTDCFYFSEGFCGVKGDNGLWGAIDVQGNLVVPTEWDYGPVFHDGEAWVFKNGNPYKIDRNGKVIGNVMEKVGSTKYKVWGVLVAVFGIGVYALAHKIGYANYNPIGAYSLFSQQWLKWLVALLGGLHTYDLLLPLGLVCYLYKRVIPKDDSTEWGTHGGLKLKKLGVVFFSMFLSLRLFYFTLFFVNYQTANVTETKEMQIVSADYTSYHSSKSYYFYIEVDNGIPYELRVSETAYKAFMDGKTSKVLADLRKGCLDFTFVSRFRTQKPK